MAEASPHVVILAGPNGAGKSTAAPVLLPQFLGIKDFVNADVIAQGLSGFDPETVALEAGRLMLTRIHQLASERRSFAFETTLASRSFATWIPTLQESGYEFDLAFLWLPSAALACARVEERVRKGGHRIPPETVARRYDRSLSNFFRFYQPLADTWRIFDNSTNAGPLLIAEGSRERIKQVLVSETWNQIVASHAHQKED